VAGLTPTGFDKKSQDQCLQDTKIDLWATVSSKLNLSSATPLGQIVGIFAEREAKLWDAVEATRDARNPNAAAGSSLRALVNITGTEAQSKTPTITKACQVVVGAGFGAAPGDMVACLDTDPTARFANMATVSNPGGSPATLTSDFVCLKPGSQPCPAGHLVVISESLSGWTSITNPTDGVVGLDDDDDVTLRARRESEIQTEGSTTADAIRSDVLKNLQSNITNCKVLANDSDAVDANGLPPHSFEVIARGLSTDENASIALAKQILASKSATDTAIGNESEVITDADGNDHVIGFSWVTDQDVYLIVNIAIIDDEFPADGDTQIKNAIVSLLFDPGQHVVARKLEAVAFSVAGVDDVPSLYLDFAPSPTNTANLPIGARSIAKFDTGRIVVNHV